MLALGGFDTRHEDGDEFRGNGLTTDHFEAIAMVSILTELQNYRITEFAEFAE